MAKGTVGGLGKGDGNRLERGMLGGAQLKCYFLREDSLTHPCRLSIAPSQTPFPSSEVLITFAIMISQVLAFPPLGYKLYVDRDWVIIFTTVPCMLSKSSQNEEKVKTHWKNKE